MLPEGDPESSPRKFENVDVPLGYDFIGLHPKHEKGKCGEIPMSRAESWIGVSKKHTLNFPKRTKYDSNLAKVIHEVRVRAETYRTQAGVHPEFLPTLTCSCLKKHGSMGQRASSPYKNTRGFPRPPPPLLTPDEGPSLERSIFPLSFQVVTELLPFAYH